MSDRAQQAYRAAYESEPDDATMNYDFGSIKAAVRVATRVRITPEIVEAFKRHGHPFPLEPNIVPALKAAFEAAGFEVEQ